MDDPSDRNRAAPKEAAPPLTPETVQPVHISLRIDPGEPLTGTLTSNSQTAGTPFCGWMDLIAAITAHRDGHGA